MCGIAGVVRKNADVTSFQLKKMTDIISHRGPDGEGCWINSDSTVGLAHRRLSIIDLSTDGAQPMRYANNRYTITFNGEIYNYIELKRDLEKRGFSFKSKSDTEVLLALYAYRGENCLNELDGMFAFAIWDEQEQKLFCARDRFGEKPFHFYYKEGEEFIFGSEIKQLFGYGVAYGINQRILYNFFQNRHLLHDPRVPYETFFKGVYRLEPAHYLIIDRTLKLVKKNYWDIDIAKEDKQMSLNSAAEQFKEMLKSSISLRLRSDVPVGSSLSGGLDSSAIVCLIDQLNTDKKIKQKTFSARFRNFERDEGQYMEKVINATNVEPFFTYPTELEFAEDFQKLCYHQEEPFGGASIFAQWEVMKLARHHGVTVLLDGQGADELLAGYHFYFTTYLRELYQSKSPLFSQELLAYRQRHNPTFVGPDGSLGATPKPVNKPIRQQLRLFAGSVYRSVFSASKTQSGQNFLSNEYTNQFTQADKLVKEHTGGLKEQLYVNTRVIGLNNLLRFADRNSMAFSRELRLPFLDHKLVEFVFSLPSEYKIRDGWTKYVMRKAMEDVMPKEITWRTDKIGYEPPQKKWMSTASFKELSHQAVTKLKANGIVNSAASSENLGADDEWACLVVANTLKL